jgi:beta-phosphoglucomutase
MFDAVLFELEGVVADTHGARREALLRSLADDGVTLSDEEYAAECAGKPVREAVRAAVLARGAGADETAVDLAALRAERYFSARLGKGLSLAPGARQLIEALAGRARLAVVTRASRRETDLVLALADLQLAFECAVTADDVGAPKPAPEPYERALARLARRRPVPPTRALALEDAESGVRAARSAGVRCVAVGELTTCDAVAADAYLPSLAGQTPASLVRLVAVGTEHVR